MAKKKEVLDKNQKHYDKIIASIDKAEKGDFKSLSWLIGYSTVDSGTPLSIYIKKEIHRIRNKNG